MGGNGHLAPSSDTLNATSPEHTLGCVSLGEKYLDTQLSLYGPRVCPHPVTESWRTLNLFLPGTGPGLCFFFSDTKALGTGPSSGPHSWPEDRVGRGRRALVLRQGGGGGERHSVVVLRPMTRCGVGGYGTDGQTPALQREGRNEGDDNRWSLGEILMARVGVPVGE